MNIGDRRHVIFFLFAGGLAAYLLSAVLAAIFIVSLPMDADWCLSGRDVQTGENKYEFKCAEFKNPFQEALHRHNTRMIGRNKVILGVEFAFWLTVTLFVFHWIPKWRGLPQANKGGSELINAGILAFVVMFIIPWGFRWVLPAPAKWFPAVFLEINDAQVEVALGKIRGSLAP